MSSRTYKISHVIIWIIVLCIMCFCILVASDIIKLPKARIDDPRLTAYSGYVADGPGPADSIYSGKMKDGLFTESGALVYPDKSSYEGGFKDGLFSGYGFFASNEGWSYKGEWKDGLPHGSGIFESKNGGFYEGIFDGGMAVIEEATPEETPEAAAEAAK